MSDAPSLAPAVFAFAFAAIACTACFLASAADDLGLEFPRFPAVDWAAILPRKRGPVFCATSRRWRDPVTLRFVKAPRS